VKEKYRGRRLIAVFEPRSNSSRRNIFQEQYASSFESADMIMVPEPPMTEKIPPKERFSSEQLAADLEKRRLTAFSFPNADTLLKALVNETRSGDVVLIMSNGGFDDIHNRLLESI
jgi:UDP-N-acetylmuramate: L-alanyl-gamma-D-glutamyl-meso-diaminopimelate ligase